MHAQGPVPLGLAGRDRICKMLAAYCAKRTDIAAAYLFGSRARGDAVPQSDVDVGVFFRDARSRDALTALDRRTQITAGLEEMVGLSVDLVDLDRVSPFVFHVLFGDAVLAYDADPDQRVLGVLRQDKLYHDEIDLYLERMAYVRGRLK